MDNEEILKNLYYNELTYSYNELYKKSKLINPKITMNIVKTWYKKQESVQMTKVLKVGKKEYLPIYSEVKHSFQIDLTFMPRHKSNNNNNYVLFTAININTRYVYAYYCNNKRMETVLDLLKKMNSETKINAITCDSGSEFNNEMFKKYCKDNKIKLYFIISDGHLLGIINRFHRTLKEKIAEHFVATKKYNWIDSLDKLIYNYNHSINRGIGIEPFRVSDLIEKMIIEKKKKQTGIIQSNYVTYNIGDKCRILNDKKIFSDKTESRYSNEIYIITKVNKGSVLILKNDVNVNVKKSNIKLITSVDNSSILPVNVEEIDNRLNRRLNIAGVSNEAVINNPRIRKNRNVLNL